MAIAYTTLMALVSLAALIVNQRAYNSNPKQGSKVALAFGYVALLFSVGLVGLAVMA